MINLYSNINNIITNDEVKQKSSILIAEHIQSGNYYIILIETYYQSNGRFNILHINIDGSVPEYIEYIGNDPIYNKKIYLYKTYNGVVSCDLPEGEYNAYFVNNEGYTDVDDVLVTQVKNIYIPEIKKITEDMNYDLHLKYYIDIVSIKNN